MHNLPKVNTISKQSQIFTFGNAPAKLQNYSFPADIHSDLRFVMKIVAGDQHIIMLLGNNQILVCGSNMYGQLGLPKDQTGDKLEEPKINPIKMENGNELCIIDIACGANHTVLLGKTPMGSKQIIVFGNEIGLGFGDLQDRFIPTELQIPIDPMEIEKIYASFNRSLIVTDTGKLIMWGEDFWGDKIDKPKEVYEFKTKIICFSVGYCHAIAITGISLIL